MSDVWVGIVNRFVEKLFNVKGGPTIVDISPSIQTRLAIASENENRYLQGWNRYGTAIFVAAVAAQNGQVQLRNPAGSNVVVVVESLVVAATAADQPSLTWGATVSDLTTLASLTFSRIDSRGNPQPTAIVSSTTDGANAAVFRQLDMTANTSVEFVPTQNCEFTVLPGQILKVFSNVVNQNLNTSWLWRERVMETSELT